MSPRHPLCPDPPPLGRNDTCSYEVSYFGEHIEEGQSSSGRFGWDVFTFKSEIRGQQKQQQLVTNVAFGCGIMNHIDTGPQGPEGNPIAGLLGLAYEAPSNFLKQLRNITLERFSYCLPMDVESANETLIHFGKAAQISGPNVQTTPILGQGGYHVQLKGIRLNGRLVPIDPKLFMKPVSETVIDSGTQHSFITAKAYVILKRAVISHFQDAYRWNPLNNTRKHAGYDLCYEIHRGGRYKFPKLTLHFENAYMDLDRQSTFREYIQENQFCMTILPLDDHLQLNVLGAYQQVNHRFLFDVADLKLSFTAESC
ncbi:aspartyl protease family protein 2-like [Pyrus x bretschneideri]|uniref:aspartyl protease family protein 2-like n=1 Tax=Pyrus x bretschneideri TaxID=225117 RepID=UPI00202F5A26|nr:aspartyl protease family protein 2-like [Pyrus x bretschneideri]XP_048437310.1 aspartyl protease family protein 2-like [Pyrus x bretschneideri]XP_048437311.1 aspartyl protease family protein 2-like [Pyrus x bretschneideri]XP_048437312.1 aspartyl protease family protein 2-like [Pyrus x bretschneideri]XP_048437313.1 aspartyl protease family protein 2-like [Pyrus x bretschneideri]XP_048437314.1 aspartyl protease family protein 2-like [Pyrus x bretschneideri]XP_048437315.1 aspartyl protease fa